MPYSTTAPTSASRRSMYLPMYLAACSAAAIVFVQLLSATFASAQSPTNAVKEFGLFGTWAGDCRCKSEPRQSICELFGHLARHHSPAQRLRAGLWRHGLSHRRRQAHRPVSNIVASVAHDRRSSRARHRHDEGQGQDSHMVVARRRRERICAGWPGPSGQQSRDRLDGALRHQAGRRPEHGPGQARGARPGPTPRCRSLPDAPDRRLHRRKMLYGTLVLAGIGCG